MTEIMETRWFSSDKMKVVLTSCLLLFMPLMPLIYNSVPSDLRYCFPFLSWGDSTFYFTLNPEKPVCKDLDWVVSLASDQVVFVILIVCAYLRPKMHWCIWVFFGMFGVCNFADVFLTYQQTPFMKHFGYALILMVLIHAVLYLIKSD